METLITIIISVIALFATFYQAYIQREHNKKSVEPLLQIDLKDQAGVLAISIGNRGFGPAIIDEISFSTSSEKYFRIQDCLTFNPKDYDHIDVGKTNIKIVDPTNNLEIFFKKFDGTEVDENISEYRRQLSQLKVEAKGHDFYKKEFVVSKPLFWFVRHENKN